MSYEVPGLQPDRRLWFAPGTNLLVSGASSEAESVLLDVVAEAPSDETTVVITLNRPAGWVVSRFHERGRDPSGSLGIVDATGQNSPVDSGVLLERAGSPADLTGISLEFAKVVKRFEQEDAGDQIRIGLASISTLLMYSEVQTVFRFLHVFTSRIQSAGLFGVFALDPGMHDDQVVNTVRAIFEAEARVDDGSVELIGDGFLDG